MNDKKRTKLLAIIIALIVGTLLSLVLSWIIVQIFTRNPEEIFNITFLKLFAIFKIEEGIQVFILCLLCFILLIAVSSFKSSNLDDYLSKTYQVTNEIRIPVPVGKEQTQQGSSWWLEKKKYSKVFGVNTFDPANPTIKYLLDSAKKERKKEKYLMENQNKIIPGENRIIETVKPIFKSGGLVVGKKDKKVFNPHIEKYNGKIKKISFFRKVEEIYYIKDDMHSLTVGATRSGKTRCLVLQSIENTALAGENMIISDPKRRTLSIYFTKSKNTWI